MLFGLNLILSSTFVSSTLDSVENTFCSMNVCDDDCDDDCDGNGDDDNNWKAFLIEDTLKSTSWSSRLSRSMLLFSSSSPSTITLLLYHLNNYNSHLLNIE